MKKLIVVLLVLPVYGESESTKDMPFAGIVNRSSGLLQDMVRINFHGSRGNETRYLKFMPFFPHTGHMCNPEGTDVIPEPVSVGMHAQVEAATNVVSSVIAVARREIIKQLAFWRSTLGQCGDMVKALKKIIADGHADRPKILCGDSKGAALALNMLGSGALKNVKGVFITSPFYHTNLGFHDFAGLPHTKNVEQYVAPIGRGFVVPRVMEEGPQPVISIEGVAQHAKHVPILMTVIMNDKKVPAYQQLALYIKLKEAGCDARLLMVEDGVHGDLEKCADKDRVEKITQSFWKAIDEGKPVDNIVPEYTAQDIRDLMKKRFNLTPEDVDARVARGNLNGKLSSQLLELVPYGAPGAILGAFAAGKCGALVGAGVGVLVRAAALSYCDYRYSREKTEWQRRLQAIHFKEQIRKAFDQGSEIIAQRLYKEINQPKGNTTEVTVDAAGIA